MANVAEASRLFDGSRLTLARNLAGLRKVDLAERVEKSATAVAAWEQGSKCPTPANVASLSVALGVDAGFFITRPSSADRENPTPHFRSLRSTSQLQRDQARAFGQLALEIAWLLERHAEFPEVDVPSVPLSDDDFVDAAIAAQEIRTRWNVGSGPIRHTIRLVETHGVIVAFSPPGWLH